MPMSTDYLYQVQGQVRRVLHANLNATEFTEGRRLTTAILKADSSLNSLYRKQRLELLDHLHLQVLDLRPRPRHAARDDETPSL